MKTYRGIINCFGSKYERYNGKKWQFSKNNKYRDSTFLTDKMDLRSLWKKHFENLYDIGSNEEVLVNF